MMWDSKGLATLSHLGTSPMAILLWVLLLYLLAHLSQPFPVPSCSG